ncbi:unnamed protein product [Symbiodinium microadriaticum]|nr:unnamed protein product [Symbiodinium microadriaticum]
MLQDTIFKNYKSVFSRQFGVSLVVEFIGVMFFQIIGGTSAPSMAPFVNGFALAVWIYVAANISGGHLNPAVSLSTAICGFYPLVHTCLYILLQICGAILGALVTSALVPGADAKVGSGLTGPGCFDRSVIHTSLTDGQVFGWECVMTFTLISTVYACGVAKPGHGSFTPFAVGLSLLCCAGSGGQYTGAALNPARVLGPTAVFKWGEDVAYLYVLGEFTAAILAMSVFACVSGLGPLLHSVLGVSDELRGQLAHPPDYHDLEMDKALVICVGATVHTDARFSELRHLWEKGHHCQLKKALGGANNPAFGRQYQGLEFDLEGEINVKCPLLVSLASDVYVQYEASGFDSITMLDVEFFRGHQWHSTGVLDYRLLDRKKAQTFTSCRHLWEKGHHCQLKKALGGANNPAFGRQYQGLEFDLEGEINMNQCPLLVSLASDVYALKALSQHRDGNVSMSAWHTLGYVSAEELAKLRFTG